MSKLALELSILLLPTLLGLAAFVVGYHRGNAVLMKQSWWLICPGIGAFILYCGGAGWLVYRAFKVKVPVGNNHASSDTR